MDLPTTIFEKHILTHPQLFEVWEEIQWKA